ncbi:sulfite exporter TauE/SafE [bacterium BMS3Abin07]|nr:sulfite exporter TauE/SafE [bacterium BMS3Abin07]GBE32628.1 sulfite exporter TauE/SafE [bacterium BMS3Bbin05]HDO23564.1 sulfite exporter TauE/SafE family protein [Nitrospirota bacterium]
MDFLRVLFPVSGVETYIFIPPLVAFVISFFTSMGGVSGAFLILPFQMSVLGFTTPSVSSTNFLYNIVGIPGGVYRYIHERRMCWPLTWVIVSGTLPGVLGGYYIRVRYLPDPGVFKFFVGLVLLFTGFRLFRGLGRRKKSLKGNIEREFDISNIKYSLRRIEYNFNGERVSFGLLPMFCLALVVGVIGGIYGIGGGAIIAPFCVSVFGLPVYTVAGAALMGTFITSFAGISIYSLVDIGGKTAPPDWLLGFLFGLGGLLGMYLGAKTQKYVSEKIIKVILATVILIVSVKYIVQFFS